MTIKKNIKTVVIILTVTLFMTGCWQIAMEGEPPNDYLESKRNIESLYGSTQEDMARHFGNPVWTEHIGESTYFIYEWQSADKRLFGMIAFIPFPVPVPIGSERSDNKWYCLLLEFDDENHLIHHEAAVYTPAGSFNTSAPCKILFGFRRSFSGCHGTWSEMEECAKEKYERKPSVR